MPAARLYRGGYLPFTRGYAYRPQSTQANEIDRNLMFYYEHLNLYDPREIRTSTSSDESFRERPSRQQSREGRDAPVELPPSPPRTPTPTPMHEYVRAHDIQTEEQHSEEEGRATPSQDKSQHQEGFEHHQDQLEQDENESEQQDEEDSEPEDGNDDSEPDSEDSEQEETNRESTPTTATTPTTSTPPTTSTEATASATTTEAPPAEAVVHNESNSVPAHIDDHIHRLSTDAPPSYRPPTVHPPSYLTHHTTTLLESSCPPALTENLRRFLLFSLAIDYDLVTSCPEPLDQADWLPFLRLARHWAWRDSRMRYMQGYDPVRPAFLGNPGTSDAAADDERALRIEQCIFAVVVRPAIALGVPADIATTTLRQFPTSITSSGTHLPFHHRYRSPSTKALATKLLLDREILFDTITQHHHQAFRSALHEANERIEKQHFVRLRSPDDYELTQFGLMREKLEGRKMMEGLERGWGLDGRKRAFSPKGRKRFSRWVRKLSSS